VGIVALAHVRTRWVVEIDSKNSRAGRWHCDCRWNGWGLGTSPGSSLNRLPQPRIDPTGSRGCNWAIPLKKAVDGVDQIFSASWERFPNKDAEGRMAERW